MKDKRGFTLIELIVILALAGIVIAVVMSFFIANYRSYQTINTESELQYQSQYIINFMTNKILEAEEFRGKEAEEYVFIVGGKKMIFAESDRTDEYERYIRYKLGDEGFQEIGNYVERLEIVPENSNEVKIILTMKKGKSNRASDEQIVYMRNSKN